MGAVETVVSICCLLTVYAGGVTRTAIYTDHDRCLAAAATLDAQPNTDATCVTTSSEEDVLLKAVGATLEDLPRAH